MIPRVSIGMPVRNCERTVAIAIRSILNQTYCDWELLVLDDSSCDSTFAVASGFHDPRIRVIADGFHAGLPARLNQAVRLSRGKYFARMDGDDVSFPGRLERQIAYLDGHPEVDLLAASILVFQGNGTVIGQRSSPSSHAEICRRPWGSFAMPHPTWLGRIEWFQQHPYDRRAIRAEDQELLLRTYRQSRLAATEEVLLGYREDRLRLSSIARGRLTHVRAAVRLFCAEHEYAAALAAVGGHSARMAIDVVAILSGLDYRLLRHRARPATAAVVREWKSVWALNQADGANQ